MNTPSDSPADGFSYSRAFFEELVDSALGHAKKLGATDAGAEASEGCGLSVSVRKGEIETVERNRDKSLGVTVYLGSRRGNASTSDFSKAAIAQTVQAAYDIARFTAEDPIAGFGLRSPDYLRVGEDLAAAGLPTLFVFEGGYAVAEAGTNAVNVLDGFRQRAG